MQEILLVEDHDLIREAICAYFNESMDFAVANEAVNGLEALKLLRTRTYDLVITDISMPEMNGLELVKAMKTEFPQQKSLVLTMHNDISRIKKMMEYGAKGYILKNATKLELFGAIQKILDGGFFFDSELYTDVIGHNRNQSVEAKSEIISNKEKELLILIGNEYSDKEIAKRLHVSESQITNQKNYLINKTGCKDVAELVLFAVENEIL